MPYPDKLTPTGTLPLGWNRITWEDKAHGPQIVYTDNPATAILLRVTLEASVTTVPDSVTTQSWSEYPSGLRSCPCDKDDCPDH